MQKNDLFTSAVCKSREKYLLGQDKLLRLLDAPTYEDGLRLLNDFGFGRTANAQPLLADILYAEEQSLIEFIKEYAPKSGSANYFLLGYDFLNAEALLKAKALNMDSQKYLTHAGLLSIEELKLALNGGACKIPEISEAFVAGQKLFDQSTPTGAMLDTVFVRAQFKALLRLTKNRALKKVILTEIDLKNISISLRARDEDEYKALKIDGGTLTKAQEEALLSREEARIKSVFKQGGLYDFVLAALSAQDKPLADFERLQESFALARFKAERFSLTKDAPFILYCMYRRADIKNVRLIMVSLYNGADKTQIRTKIRVSY